MGTTIWVIGKETMSEDDWDHSALFNAVERLDPICLNLGVKNVSSFLDWSDFNANMSGGEEFPSE